MAVVAGSAQAQDRAAALASITGTWNAPHVGLVLRVGPGEATYCEDANCIRGVPEVADVVGKAIFLRIVDRQRNVARTIPLYRESARSMTTKTSVDSTATLRRE